MMQFGGEHRLPAPRERVWTALLDAQTLAAAIPGCESVTPDGPGCYRVVVMAAVGPVRARFKGRLQQQDLLPPARYTLSFEGDGGLAGFARGSAEVELAEWPGDDGAGPQTRLVYRAQAQVGGRIAQIGSRLVDATAAKLSAQFFERLAQVIAPGAVPEGAAEGVAALTPGSAAGATAAARPSVRAEGAGAGPRMVTIQMPAWAFAFTLVVLALLVGWVASR